MKVTHQPIEAWNTHYSNSKAKGLLSIRLTAIYLALVFLMNHRASAQKDTLLLDDCYRLAIENSEINRQLDTYKHITIEEQKVATSGYLPKIELNGQFTYQSDVTELPIKMPGMPELPKDRYNGTIDFTQLIYDGGYIKQLKELQASTLEINNAQTASYNRQLKDRISSLYLGILLLEENLNLTNVFIRDIELNIEKLTNLLTGGLALQKDIDNLEVEHINAEQRIIEIQANRKNLLQSLGYLCGQSLPDNLALKFPNAVLLNNDTINNRPELKLFSAQDMSFQSRISLIKTKNNPKLYLFASGGYGKPGLNMFNDELDSYGIAGIRLTIPITNRLYGKHETQSLIYQKELITSQRTDFLKNNTIQLSGQLIEIEKFKSLIDKDEEIITKRTAIRIAEETRLNNGISTSTDYIRELNAENRAKLNLKLHEIQLLQAIINYNALKGN